MNDKPHTFPVTVKQPKAVRLRFELDVTLDVAEVWPNGDAPEQITEAAVRETIAISMHRDHNTPPSGTDLHGLIHDWNLAEHLTLDVTVTPPDETP